MQLATRIVFASLCAHLLPDSRALPAIVRETLRAVRGDEDANHIKLKQAVEHVHQMNQSWFDFCKDLHKVSANAKLELAAKITADAYNEQAFDTVGVP